MKLTFGLSLDSYKPRQPCFNHQFCGPAGLVNALELRLGLAAVDASSAVRTSSYLAALEACSASGERFFNRSLQADRWSTAQVLLAMRDDLQMAGWNGEFDASSPSRLRDFAAVETLAAGSVAPGLAERIAVVRAELVKRRVKSLEVESIEPVASLPWLLRGLLEDLGARHVDIEKSEATLAGSNLRLVQDFLTEGRLPDKTWNPDDESVIFVTAHSEITLAHAAALLLKDSANDAVVVAQAAGELPAEILRGQRLPAPALDPPSGLRPIPQALPLALALRWSPLDPEALLAFLTHPVCPVSGPLRHRLAETVCDRPGIGSSRWENTLLKHREQIMQKEGISEEEKKALWDRACREMDDWILIDRFPRESGAPGSIMAETANRVAQWAARMAGVSGDSAEARQYAFLAAASREMAGLLAGIGMVAPEETARILEQIMKNGLSSGAGVSELGCPECLRSPAAAIEPCGTMLWWGFDSGSKHLPQEWTSGERAFLAEHGIHLQSAGDLLAMSMSAAKRPFFAARERIVLMWPRQRAHEPIDAHPLLTLLRTAFPSIPVRNLDQDELPIVGTGVMSRRPVIPLPARKRWLHLPDATGMLDSRDEESFSSISKFIHRPFEWVFNYKARLKRPQRMRINLMTQRGNLLHRVVEVLLADDCPVKWQTIDQAEFAAWLEKVWNELLETEGANYLLPGRLTEGRRLLEDAQRATWRLIVHLRGAGVVIATADVSMAAVPLGPVKISGIIDLLANNAAGRRAVIDLKYGQGKAKYGELSKNTALQLAVYGHLLREATGEGWPATAYYILRTSELLASDQKFFPEARVVKSDHPAPGPETTWSEFLDVWNWRRGQLDKGWIEVPVDGTVPTTADTEWPDSTPPHEKWRTDEKALRYDDYQFLTGWEVKP